VALDLASTNQNQGSGDGPSTASQSASADQRVAPFSALLEAACEVQLLLDSEGRIVHVGGSPEYVMGYGRATLEQQPVLAAITPEQRGGFANAFQQVRSGVAQPLFAMHWPNPWQGQFEAGVQLSALVEDSKLLGVMMKAFELSSRYAFEAFQRNDAPTSLSYAKKSPMAMFFLDARGQCTFVNDRWTELTGQPTTEALGFGFLATISASDRDRFKQVAGQSHQRREGWRLLFDVALPDGSTRRVDAAAAPLLGAEGNVIAYIGAFTPFSSALASQTPVPQPVVTQVSAPEVAAARQPTIQPPSAPEVQVSPETSASEPAVAPPMSWITEPNVQPAATPPAGAPVGAQPAQVSSASSRLPFELPTDLVAQPVIENRPSSWDPPAIKEGFTDPNLLVAQKKLSTEAEVEVPPSEPGLDKVTGLANRLLFAQHVASTVTRMQSDALTVSVSFVHLHGLETVRQNIGSRATNDYLFLLAKRLEATIRSIEIAGRIEGDIVGVLSINWLFADDLPVVAQRLLLKLGEPLAGKDGQPMIVDMSLGMAVARPGEHVNELFTRAWNALQVSRQNADTHFEIDYGA
jgi:diguanylate cyclase (GGDEF)-like protein/PAS domain S-box-containing protein